MKIKLFLVLVSCNILISNAAKKDYTYNLVQTSPESVIEDEKNYAYPGVSYQYIINIENYNGSSIGDFTILLDNGKFEDGSKTKTVFNAEPIYVYWDDTPNVSASIKISSAIKLWNECLGYVRTFEVTESVNQISLQGLPNGMYIVLIVQDGKTLQRKIVWKN